MKRQVFSLLLVLNFALCLGLASMWVTPDGTMVDLRWQAPEPVVTDFNAMVHNIGNPPEQAPQQVAALLDRPVFSATRRPPPPPPPPRPPAPVDHLATARLLGVFQRGDTGWVIVNIAGKQRRVVIKMAVEGWQLKSIQDRSATFQRDAEERVLPLATAALTTYSGAPRQAGAPASGLGAPNASSAQPAKAIAPGPLPVASSPMPQVASGTVPPAAVVQPPAAASSGPSFGARRVRPGTP